MRVRYLPTAEAQLAEAVEWYALVDDDQLTDRFLAEVARVERLAAERPRAWPEIAPGVRKVVMSRFPYSLFYRIGADELEVLAIAHHSRRPAFWYGRLK